MKIAVLGAGAMGAMHARIYAHMPDVTLAWIFARDTEKITPLGEELGAATTSNIDDILKDPGIAAVDICLPTPAHQQFVAAALGAGKHVFCETPLALTIGDAEGMIAAAKANNKHLLVGLLMRSVAEYQYVKQALDKGDLGKPLAAYTYRLGSYLRPDSSDTKSHYSDPTTELMTFDFDVANWLFGQPKQVFATASLMTNDQPGHVQANLQYDGFGMNVEASGFMPVSFPYSVGLRVAGEEQALEIVTKFRNNGPPDTTLTLYPKKGAPKQMQVEDKNPYEAECQYFVDCIKGSVDPELLGAERALEALKLSIATQQSLQTSAAVSTNGR